MNEHKELFAVLSTDGESTDTEGIVAFEIAGVEWPLVCDSRDKLPILRTTALRVAADSRQRLRIVRFSRREQIEVVVPPQSMVAKKP
jgi:hypothetical protein